MRTAMVAPAVVAIAGLLSAGSVGTSVASGDATSKAARPCATENGLHARVRVGTNNGSDPNDMTKAETLRAQQEMRARFQQAGVRQLSKADRHRDITIRVRFHVILRDNGTGGVSKARLKEQMRVLNDGFSGRTASNASDTAFKFRLKSVDYTKNSDWFDWSLYTDTDDEEAVGALNRGGPRILNAYVAGLQDNLLGYANYPWDPDADEGYDRLVLLNESLPGGTAAPYNEGDTATHEVGHWMGLAHTFENGCEKPGDLIQDTPYQDDGDNIFSCEQGLDTCTKPGKDPVHNFMSYGDDPCLDQFTSGQATRMRNVWEAFRA